MDDRDSRSNGRETKAHILKIAKAELEAHGPVKFNILRVIEESGVSRSSLYHHFSDRNGLITAIEVERYIEEIRFSNEMLRLVISSATSGARVFESLEVALLAASSTEGRQQRAHRIAVIAAAQSIPALQQALVEQSESGDAYLAETLEIARAKGLVATSAPMLPIARMISTLFIGRIAVDGFESEETDGAWVKMTVEILRFLLQPV